MKKVRIILLAIIILLIALGVFKGPLIKSVVTLGVTQVMGTPVHIDSFAFGIFKPTVRIKGLKIYNPEKFPKEILIDIPEISVDYDLPTLIKGKLHLPLIVVNLKEMVVIKNKEGALNVDSLKVAQKKEEEPKQTKPMPMQIDVLTLNISKVFYKDYSQGDQPIVKGYDVGVKEKTYKNITSAQQLAALIMVEAMGPTAIKGAGIYGAATLLGVGFLPAGVAGILIGKDSGVSDFNLDYDKAYRAAIETMQKIGKVAKDDMDKGIIKAKVDATDVTIEIIKQTAGKVRVKVSARKYLIPKPEIAEGVLYQISEALK